jgi:hypothetical protein
MHVAANRGLTGGEVLASICNIPANTSLPYIGQDYRLTGKSAF